MTTRKHPGKSGNPELAAGILSRCGGVLPVFFTAMSGMDWGHVTLLCGHFPCTVESLTAFIAAHVAEKMSLPCKLVLPEPVNK